MNRRRARGVTLIELLIAVTLLSLLSVGMLMALHVGLNAQQKANAKLMANRRAASTERITESLIANLLPTYADCPSEAPGAPRTRTMFFEGTPDSMRFVSTYSLEEAARGYPRILEFKVIPGQEGRGVRLIVNEMLYSGPVSTSSLCLGMMPGPGGVRGARPLFRGIEPGPHSFVLADRLAFCRFEYQESLPAAQGAVWVPEWQLVQWPSAVRIDMAPLEADPTRVPLVGLSVPIHVNRMPYENYADGR
jgi:prepilin-type N-terminal cleavage/methylation domain-containing protein